MGEARFDGVESEKREKHGTGKDLPVFPVLPNKMCRQGVQNERKDCPKCVKMREG
jgi:hypothetical protein